MEGIDPVTSALREAAASGRLGKIANWGQTMTVAEETRQIGDRLLQTLQAWGAEYIFSSPGSDWPPLWEALARAQGQGQSAPMLFTCRHEQLAVSLAMGYQRGSGKLPVVVVHTGVGALHAAMMLRTALHERIPLVVLTGQPTAWGEDPTMDVGAQWLRNLADVGGPSRVTAPVVKWAGYANDASTLDLVLRHAAEIALQPPCGPTLVSITLEMLFSPEPLPLKASAFSPPGQAWSDPRDIERAARLLIEAERPLIIAESAGHDPTCVGHLVALAEAIAAPVVEASTPAYLNFPRTHPLHQGYAAQPLVAEADVVLLAGCCVPWHPPSRWPHPDAVVIAVDDDPAQELLPMAGYRTDLRLGGSTAATLRQLAQEVQARANALPSGRQAQFGGRRAELEERHRRQRAQWDQEARECATDEPIDSRWLAHTLHRLIPEDAIVVEETTTDKQAITRHAPRSLPGTYHVRNTGGLGVMLGVAQGLKLTAPERLVVAIVGDGALHYSPALANFGFAQQYQQPILVIVSDNGAYVSMRSGHDRLYPEGWAVRTGVHPGTEIEPRPDYPALARAYGGFGERVEHPSEVESAICRALERVSAGQWALLDVVTRSDDPRRAAR
jgi:acetolactate synthase-1/2/3 large subunit